MKNEPKEKKVKQEGTSDLGAFLRELEEMKYRLPKKLMNVYAQCNRTGHIWRDILREEKV